VKNRAYEIITAKTGFLGSVQDLFDDGQVNFYVPENTEKINRKVFDGFITFTAMIQGQVVGVCFNDFRSFGSSAGIENSHRVCAFIDYLDDRNIPLIYLANSIGVRVQDGRNVFKNSFSIITKIKNFCRSNLYISACLGHCLGLSAVLYSLAHYRFALKDKCKFNLTGPEVFRMFFGNKVTFEEVCNEAVLQRESLLVQEISDDQEELFTSIKNLFKLDQSVIPKIEAKAIEDQLTHLADYSIELFKQFGKSIEIRLINTESGRIGLIINPYKKPNMMTVRDMDKYMMALDLFERMKLPVYALVDTAGGDPRIEENNKNIAKKLYDLSCKIIDYPYRKQGIVTGRCYGGSAILSMPSFFGGEKSILVNGAHIGIMGDKIVEQLLSATPAMLETWKENKKNEKEDYSDFIESGILEKVIDPVNLVEYIVNEAR
jgi:acetyl-CoA carboxylase carboxyltransferase component